MSAEPVYNVACHVQTGYVEQDIYRYKVPQTTQEGFVHKQVDVHVGCCGAGDCQDCNENCIKNVVSIFLVGAENKKYKDEDSISCLKDSIPNFNRANNCKN